MQLTALPRTFYAPSARVVAPRLLGHWLIRRTPDGICGGPIVETEAYLVDDPASHGFTGETARNKPMYGPPGMAYVYFIYGVHFCVNAVCQPTGKAEAVLIRAIEPEFGLAWMQTKRPSSSSSALTNGPGKLCAAMGIGRESNGADLCKTESGLIIARNPQRDLFRRRRGPVSVAARIGLSRAAEIQLRFYLTESPFVSRRGPEVPTSAGFYAPRIARPKC